jgi:thiol:disulfide interchange protein DsbC
MNITLSRRTTITLLLRALSLALLCATNTALADNHNTLDKQAIEETIRKALPNTKIDSVAVSVIPGLVEIVAGDNVLYSDPSGQYLVVGNIYDMHTATDLTAELKRSGSSVEWSSLPLATAIHYPGTGSQKLAIFFDPDCPWCKRLYQQLSTLKDVDLYLVMYPIEGLHPDAKQKTAAILCAPEPRQALSQVMSGQALPPVTDHACLDKATTSFKAVKTFATAHNIHGTPTLISGDGRIRPGFLQETPLRAWLNVSSTQGK